MERHTTSTSGWEGQRRGKTAPRSAAESADGKLAPHFSKQCTRSVNITTGYLTVDGKNIANDIVDRQHHRSDQREEWGQGPATFTRRRTSLPDGSGQRSAIGAGT
jgi:hypothetical protein